MDTIKKAIGSAFDPNTDIPDLSGKVSSHPPKEYPGPN